MKTLLPVIIDALSAGQTVALATVLLAKGSAPRGAGACQLLLADGKTVGTVGGGVLEHRALGELQALLDHTTVQNTPSISTVQEPTALLRLTDAQRAESHTETYNLTQDDAQSLGMVCGGNVTLAYQALAPDMLPFFLALQQSVLSGRSVWLARELLNGAVVTLAVVADGVSGVSSGAPTLPGVGRQAAWLAPDGSPTAEPLGSSWFLEPVVYVSHAYIFGGGHVAQCVAPLLAQLDFDPLVYDDRPEFANPSLFPASVRTLCAPFPEAGARLSIAPEDEIVIMTRGHVNDLVILTQALRSPAYYIGLIGSRAKIAHTREMLMQSGFTGDDFARVHTPIGLPIRAETPMEIAVSVAAEMILARATHADAGMAAR